MVSFDLFGRLKLITNATAAIRTNPLADKETMIKFLFVLERLLTFFFKKTGGVEILSDKASEMASTELSISRPTGHRSLLGNISREKASDACR